MSLQDLYDLAPPDDTQDEDKQQQQLPPPPPFVPPPPELTPEELSYQQAMAAPDVVLPGQYASLADNNHIPLDHATALASPPAGPPAATVGVSPQAPSPPAPIVNAYQYLLSRGGANLNAHNLSPVFANRLTSALMAAESATGHRAQLNDLYRSPEQQAQYYADYTKQPVNFNGVTYQPNPNNQGGLAAPPSTGLHPRGLAADVNSGPVLDYLHQNAGQFGLEFLRHGHGYEQDPVHIQMAGGSANAPGVMQAPPGNINVQGAQQFTTMQTPSSLGGMRQSYFSNELADPNIRRLIAATTAAEVGGQGPQAEQAFIEAVINRAMARNQTLSHAFSDPNYYPDTTTGKLGRGFGPEQQGHINDIISRVMAGSNISNFATGNESGKLHSMPVALDLGTGERFVHESADRAWLAQMLRGGFGAAPGGASGPSYRDTGTARGPIGRQYALADTGTMTDAAEAPDEEQQVAANVPSDEEVKNMRDYLESLKTPAPAQTIAPEAAPAVPAVPPVDLQAPVLPPVYPQDITEATQNLTLGMPAALPPGSAITPSGLTHTVIGADGNLQTIHETEANADPTIGMSRGTGMSTEVMQKIANGDVPPIQTLSPEQQRAMTHTAVGPKTDLQRIIADIAASTPRSAYEGLTQPLRTAAGTMDPEQAAMESMAGGNPAAEIAANKKLINEALESLIEPLDLPKPQTGPGRVAESAVSFAADPTSYIGGGGALAKISAAVFGGLGAGLAGEASKGLGFAASEPLWRMAGGMVGGSLGTRAVLGSEGAITHGAEAAVGDAAKTKIVDELNVPTAAQSAMSPAQWVKAFAGETTPGTSPLRTGTKDFEPTSWIEQFKKEYPAPGATVNDAAIDRYLEDQAAWEKAHPAPKLPPAANIPEVPPAPPVEGAPLRAILRPGPGFVRFYHGGDNPGAGGGRWVSPSYTYARDYRSGQSVHYVDIPQDWLDRQFDPDIFGHGNMPYPSFEVSEAVAKSMKPIAGPSSVPARPVPKPPMSGAVGELGGAGPRLGAPITPRQEAVELGNLRPDAPATGTIPDVAIGPRLGEGTPASAQLTELQNLRPGTAKLPTTSAVPGAEPMPAAGPRRDASGKFAKKLPSTPAPTAGRPSEAPGPVASTTSLPVVHIPTLQTQPKVPTAAATPPAIDVEIVPSAPGQAAPAAPAATPVAPAATPVSAPPASTTLKTRARTKQPAQPAPSKQPGLTQTAPAAAPPAAPPAPPAAAPPAAPAAPAPATPQQPYTPLAVRDYVRMADDQTAPLTNYAARAGLDHGTVEELRQELREKTGAQSQAVANAAANNGVASAPGVSYNTPSGVSLRQIQTYATRNPGFKDYLNMHDTLDDIRRQSPPGQQTLPLQPGPVSVRGFTEQDALQYIRNADHSHPDWARVRGLFNEHRQEARRFMTDGEFGVMTPKEHADANATRPNEIPWRDRDMNRGHLDSAGRPIVRPDPILQMLHHVSKGVRRRLNNEAVGRTVDAIRKSPRGYKMFTPITAEALSKSPKLRERAVSFKRRGEVEHYLADSRTVSDLLKMDPYGFNWYSWAASVPRRGFVQATTGIGSPHFAVTDALRNWHIAQGTVAEFNRGKYKALPRLSNRRNAPSLFGLTTLPAMAIRKSGGTTGLNPFAGTLPYAMTSQLIPKLARFAAHSIDSTSGGWLRRTFGNRMSDQLATVLANTYAKSTVAQVEARGVHTSSFMRMNEDRVMANQKLVNAIERMKITPGLSQMAAILNAYKSMLNATHNATQFAYVQRNMRGATKQARAELGQGASQAEVNSRAMDILTSEANLLVGDPLTTGRLFTPGSRGEQQRMITFDPGQDASLGRRIWGHTAGSAATGWAVANAVGRATLPWHNMTMQGAKRFIQAAQANPTEFAMRAALYYMLPAGIGYYWNARAGKDPNGVTYVHHQMFGRNEYDQSMYQYIAIPGQPAADGIEFPTFQENTFFKRSIEAMMNHIWGNSVWTLKQDLQAALTSMLDVAILPPAPPGLTMGMESLGVSGPSNLGAFLPDSIWAGLGQNTGNVDIGGDIYKRKNQPYDTNRTMAQTMESTLRAIMPAPVDMALAGYNALTHSPNDTSWVTRLGNSFKATGRLEAQRTPVLRDFMDIHKPASGVTRITAEMFNRQKAIDQLDTYFHNYGMEGQTYIGKSKPRSKSGAIAATAEMGPQLPPNIPGLAQNAPTNPIYKDFMNTFYNMTKHDSDKTGGIGFLSMLDRYHDATKAIGTMRNIDAGNMVTWQHQLRARPDVMQFIKQNNVDPNNPSAVRNLYERNRQHAALKINHVIDQVEKLMSAKYGRPIKIEDLDPHSAPSWTAGAIQGLPAAPEEGISP